MSVEAGARARRAMERLKAAEANAHSAASSLTEACADSPEGIIAQLPQVVAACPGLDASLHEAAKRGLRERSHRLLEACSSMEEAALQFEEAAHSVPTSGSGNWELLRLAAREWVRSASARASVARELACECLKVGASVRRVRVLFAAWSSRAFLTPGLADFALGLVVGVGYPRLA